MELWIVGSTLGLHLPPQDDTTTAPAPAGDRWGGLPDPIEERMRAHRDASRRGAGSGPTLNVGPGRQSARRLGS